MYMCVVDSATESSLGAAAMAAAAAHGGAAFCVVGIPPYVQHI